MSGLFSRFKKAFTMEDKKYFKNDDVIHSSSSSGSSSKKRNQHNSSKNQHSTSSITSVSHLNSESKKQRNCDSKSYSTLNEYDYSDSRERSSFKPASPESAFTGFTKSVFTGGGGSIKCLETKRLMSHVNYNNASVSQIRQIRQKLLNDFKYLTAKNEKFKLKLQIVKETNERLRNELLDLEKLNQKLLSENTEVVQEAIKHKFLKLESDDLNRQTKQYKQKLEEKENMIVNFQKQCEAMKIKNNLAFKKREEALLEVSHASTKLKELHHECEKLDIYKSENLQRRYYFNELQTFLGNTRVYLKVLPTLENSCLSFIADDKVLIKNDEKVSKKGDDKNEVICRFTKVFQPNSSNADLFDEIEPLLLTTVDGFNCCFILFGQTGTEKSNTLFGEATEDNLDGILSSSVQFFWRVTEESVNWKYELFVSALLIYQNFVIDVFRKKPISVEDDGTNLTLKCTQEHSITSKERYKQLLRNIKETKRRFKPKLKSTKPYTHLVVILRLVGNCQMSGETTTGIATFCELADFDDHMSLLLSDRENLREEKHLNDTFLELGSILTNFKRKSSKKNYPKFILTKLLYPCFDENSKICLILHCLNEKEQHCNILKSIRFGLAVMPKQTNVKKGVLKNSVIWNFDNDS